MPDESISDVEPSTDSEPAPTLLPPFHPPRVVKIHLDRPCRVKSVLLTGLSRTKSDYITDRVKGVLDLSNYQELLQGVAETRDELSSMGIFKKVDAVLDRGSGMEDILVKFDVVERNITAKVGVEVGDNAATGTLSLSLPNLWGRGEKLSMQWAAPNPGSDRSRDYKLSLQKPYTEGAVKSVEISLGRTEYQLDHFNSSNLSHRAEASCAVSSFIGRHILSLDWDWREFIARDARTSLHLREHAGHSLKSAIRHTLFVDSRDNSKVISPGVYLSTTQEFSGLVPDSSKYLKAEIQSEANMPLFAGIIMSITGRTGYLHSLRDNTHPLDRFLLGGPTTLRGFNLWGLTPRDRDCSLGANTYWAGGAHLFSPLPFWSEGLGQYFKLHAFATVGNLFNVKRDTSIREVSDGFRLSVGLGFLWKISYIRLEVNWCQILLSSRRDSFKPGLQFGVGMDFL